MKNKEVKQLTFWIVGALFVCYSVCLVQENEPGLHPSRLYVNTSTKHYKIRIAKAKSDDGPGHDDDTDDRFGIGSNLNSWVKVNDTDPLTANGGINNSEVKSIQTDDQKRSKRSPEKFECVVLLYDIYIPHVFGGSVGPCVDLCWLQETERALLQKEKCICVRDDYIYEQYNVTDISKCSTRCKDNNKQLCGGENVWSKYETGYVDPPKFEGSSAADLKKVYMYCFEMRKDLRHLPYLVTIKMHPRMCIEYCKKKRLEFAGLHSGDFCQCLPDPFKYKLLKYTEGLECHLPCAGDSMLVCGSDVKDGIQVYYTGYDVRDKKFAPHKGFDDMSWTKTGRKPDSEYDYDLSKKIKAAKKRVKKKMKGKTKKNKDKRKKNKRKMKKNKGRNGKRKGIKKEKVKKGKKNRNRKNRRKKTRKNRKG